MDPKRYLILGIVFMATCVLDLAWRSNLWGRRYEIEARDQGGFYYIFFRFFNQLSMVIFYLPASYLTERHGVSKGLTIGMILCSTGAWFCFFKQYTLGCVFIGSAWPFVLNVITKVSSSWFGPRGRSGSTTILFIGIFLP